MFEEMNCQMIEYVQGPWMVEKIKRSC